MCYRYYCLDVEALMQKKLYAVCMTSRLNNYIRAGPPKSAYLYGTRVPPRAHFFLSRNDTDISTVSQRSLLVFRLYGTCSLFMAWHLFGAMTTNRHRARRQLRDQHSDGQGLLPTQCCIAAVPPRPPSPGCQPALFQAVSNFAPWACRESTHRMCWWFRPASARGSAGRASS